MTIKLTMSLVSESQEGDCGDDWMYELEAKVFCEGLKGDAVISVPKHTLEPGEVSKPYGLPDPVVLFEGECGDEVLVRLMLTATEVDMFINDVGKVSKDIRIEKPNPIKPSLTREVDIAAGVRESPGIRDKNSVFNLRVRFTVENTA